MITIYFLAILINKNIPIKNNTMFAIQMPIHGGTSSRIAHATPANIIPQYTINKTMVSPKLIDFSLLCILSAIGIPIKTNIKLENAKAILL